MALAPLSRRPKSYWLNLVPASRAPPIVDMNPQRWPVRAPESAAVVRSRASPERTIYAPFRQHSRKRQCHAIPRSGL